MVKSKDEDQVLSEQEVEDEKILMLEKLTLVIKDIKAARQDFQQAENKYGKALCQYQLGYMYWKQARHLIEQDSDGGTPSFNPKQKLNRLRSFYNNN